MPYSETGVCLGKRLTWRSCPPGLPLWSTPVLWLDPPALPQDQTSKTSSPQAHVGATLASALSGLQPVLLLTAWRQGDP